MDEVKFSNWDRFLSYVGLAVFLLDLVLDVLTVVAFYREGEYVYLGILVVVLVGSSLVVQVYSWLFFTKKVNGKVPTITNLSLGQLKVIHLLLMGVYLRHIISIDIVTRSCITKGQISKLSAFYASQDLSLIQVFEAFTESAPQLVLMLTNMLQRGQLHYLTVLKASGSAFAIALSLINPYRYNFLLEKKQDVGISVVYFLLNLLFISSRLSAMAMFASVHPCLIFPHCVCSWMLLFFCARRTETNFVDSPRSEWLYRGTMGLVWYFGCIKYVKRNGQYKLAVYHSLMLLDICLLCASWWWTIHTPNSIYTLVAVICVILSYVLGLMLRVVYHMLLHPYFLKPRFTWNALERVLHVLLSRFEKSRKDGEDDTLDHEETLTLYLSNS
ncbi:XK-related protein 8-like [Stigmatopora argus]